MLGRTDSRARALVVLLVFVLVAGSLGVRLAYWQVTRRDELAAMAVRQSSMSYEIPSRRGSIYDRTGTVALATTVSRDLLAATPRGLTPERRVEVARELVRLLGLEGDAADSLTSKMVSDAEYKVLARDLDPALSDQIRAELAGDQPKLSGLELVPEPVRVYPQPGGAPDSTLAAHLLGFVNRDGQGQYGVEQYYQDQLAGSPRRVAAQKDASGNPVPDTSTVLDPGYPGQDMTLTIDASLQVAVEQELLATWIADRATRVSAVVMDPYTGEVYAYGSYPSYDENDYQAIATNDPSRFIDPIVSTVYEPGSVFKMLTSIAAFSTGTVTMNTIVNDTGTLMLDHGRSHVDDADHRPMGRLRYQDAIAYSRNVVAAKVALKLGSTTQQSARILYGTWQKLGFGALTGIDTANEVPGLLRDPATRRWAEVDVANGAFGQGVAVTPIQLAQAFSAMVNGGVLVQPRVVKAIGGSDTAAIYRGRVISEDLSKTLRKLMHHVVSSVSFYRTRTLIPGFEVGGKTGTAQIWDAEKGRWKVDKFNYSFIGYIGRQAGHPDLVVAVRIEEGTPTVIRLGQLEMPVMSFELFRRIAHDAINTPDLLTDTHPIPPLAGDDPASADAAPMTVEDATGDASAGTADPPGGEDGTSDPAAGTGDP
jgi:stage V sporulation protein D (sporulation-specific penicillin-binding protein)